MRYALLIIMLCLMVACNATTPPVAPDATAAVPTTESETVEPTETAAIASDTPATVTTEAITPTAEIAATAVVTATESAEVATGLCDEPVYEAFEAAWEANGASGCPTSEAEVGNGAIQPFTNGTMIWTSESDEEPAYIYVLVSDGTWQKFEDEWEEGDVEDADLTPPAGAIEPKRGFGLVWRNELGGPDATIGWGLVEEAAQEVAVQSFGDDTALASNGQVFWLSGNGTWK